MDEAHAVFMLTISSRPAGERAVGDKGGACSRGEEPLIVSSRFYGMTLLLILVYIPVINDHEGNLSVCLLSVCLSVSLSVLSCRQDITLSQLWMKPMLSSCPPSAPALQVSGLWGMKGVHAIEERMTSLSPSVLWHDPPPYSGLHPRD